MANQYKNKIIYNGEPLIDLTSDTVSAATLLNGITAHDKSGAPIVGTYVLPVYQAKTNIVPTTSSQTIQPDNGYDALSSVQINAIPSQYIVPSGTKTITENGTGIDVTSYANVNVAVQPSYTCTLETLSAHRNSFTYNNTIYRTSNTSFQFHAGDTLSIEVYGEMGGASIKVDGANIGSCDMNSPYTYTLPADNITINTVSSGGSAAVNITTASGVVLQAKTNITPTTSSQTITPDSGYDALSSVQINAMPTGVTTSPTSISGTAATVSTGTNTLTLTKTVSVTPRVTTAGYVSAGTAGNSSVSLTANVTTKAAATITPGTSNQTIASGTYLTGIQTIAGDADLTAANIKVGANIFNVAGSYTSDATAAAADILSGETAYVNGSKLTGTLVVQNFYTGSSSPSSSLGQVGDLYLQM